MQAVRLIVVCSLLGWACTEDGAGPGDSGAPADTTADRAPEPDRGLTADAAEPLVFSKIGKPVRFSRDFIFAEGPVWEPKLGALLFSDINADTIYKLTLPGTFSAFRKPSNNANGLALDRQGRLLVAEHGSRSVTRRMLDGTYATVASSYTGKRLNSPNDLVVRTDGTIYFTDPTFGLKGGKAELGFMGLFRVSPGGSLALEQKIDGSPNGLGLSPAQNTLYVAVTFKNQLLAFDLAKDGTTSNPRVFATLTQPDGMAVDRGGNLYVASNSTAKPELVVFNSAGKRLGAVALGHRPSNCAFGEADGKTLFVTAHKDLYRLSVPVPGW